MSNSISQFLNLAGPVILERGRDYFRNGHVVSFEEIEPGEYEAVVEGTDNYIVNFKVIDGNIEDHSCTCPYDYGSICKHIMAAVLYLQKETGEIRLFGNKSKKERKSAVKKNTVAEQIDKLLDSVTHDDLKVFIRRKCISDPSFRRQVMSGLMYKSAFESPEKYREQIKDILRSAKDKNNFIPWSRVGSVGKAVSLVLDTAMNHITSGNWLIACYICFPVAEEMVKALDYADDSNADIGDNISFAFDILAQISESAVPEEIRTYLFDYVIKEYKREIFSGWDWQINLLEMAVRLVRTDHEAKKVMDILSVHPHHEFESEEMTRLEYELLRKMSGEDEAQKFLEQNLDNPDLRRKALSNALRKNDLKKLDEIAREGIDKDSAEKPGLALEWYDWLLKAAMKKGDTEKIVEYARYLFVDGFRHEQDYYSILKKNIEPGKWNDFVEGIVNDIRRRGHFSDADVIAKIFINEQWWQRLLDLVSSMRHLPAISHYERYLSDEYANELAEVYEKGIREYLKRVEGRNHYREACGYIRRMKKLGGRKKVTELVLSLRSEYPKRKALLEELSLI